MQVSRHLLRLATAWDIHDSLSTLSGYPHRTDDRKSARYHGVGFLIAILRNKHENLRELRDPDHHSGI